MSVHLTYNSTPHGKDLSTITINNPGHGSSILEQLNKDRAATLFTDTIISVDQEDFPCHRCIVASSSPYFEAMFSSSFREGLTSRLILQDTSPWIVKRLIEYIYTGKLEITIDTAQDYLKAGHMLGFPLIIETCCHLVAQHLHPSNCLGVREFALLYDCKKLEQRAFQYALHHFESVLAKPVELCRLSLHSLQAYLNHDNIDVSDEMLIWKAIKTWIDCDPLNRTMNLSELLPCVRFSSLSQDLATEILDDQLVRVQKSGLNMGNGVFRFVVGGAQQYGDGPDNESNMAIQKPARPSTVARPKLTLLCSRDRSSVSMAFVADVAKKRLIDLPALPEAIVKPSVTVFNNDLWIFGGIVNNLLSRNVWKYSHKCHKWINETKLPQPRVSHASVSNADKIYVTGGITLGSKEHTEACLSIDSYCTTSQTWTSHGKIQSARKDAILLASNQTLYLLGGTIDGIYSYTMETYQIGSDGSLECTDGHYILPAGDGALRAVFHNFHIYLHWEKIGEIIAMDPAKRVYRPLATKCCSRKGSSLVAHDNQLYIAGGVDNVGLPILSIEVLDLKDYSLELIDFTPNFGFTPNFDYDIFIQNSAIMIC